MGIGNCHLAISLPHSSQSGARAEATVLRPLCQMRSCKGHSDFWVDGVCLQNQIHEGSALKCMRVCMHAHVGRCDLLTIPWAGFEHTAVSFQ